MQDICRLMLAIAFSSADLERLLGDQWPPLRDWVADLLFRLDEYPIEVDTLRAADLLLEQLLESPAAEIVRPLVSAAQGEEASRRFTFEPFSAVKAATSLLTIPIFYGTDRQWLGRQGAEGWYGGDRGPMEYGVVDVTVPAHHRIGEEEGPKWWKLEFRSDPSRHIVLRDIERRDEQRFIDDLRQAMKSAGEAELFVFIHGFNVSFAEAVRRAAQIARDLKFPGQMVIYSWASKAKMRLYPADEATIEASVPRFQAFLEILLMRTGARSVHLLAHSMGNRALTRVIEQLDLSSLGEGSATLGQVVFAAPDVDRDVFEQLAVAFTGAQRYTLYASANDVALRASRLFHHYPRAGDAGDSLVIRKGIDTIDATLADTSLFGLGHSYFSDKRSILNDLYGLILNGLPPGKRFDLDEIDSKAGMYWYYRV